MTRATFSKSLPYFTFEIIYGALLIPLALCLWTEAARSQDFNPTGCWDYSIIQKNVLNQVPLGGSSQLVMSKAIIKKCLPSCAAQGETSSMSSHWVKKNFLVPGAEVSSLLVPRNSEVGQSWLLCMANLCSQLHKIKLVLVKREISPIYLSSSLLSLFSRWDGHVASAHAADFKAPRRGKNELYY